MLKQTSSKLIKKRTLKERFFKLFCRSLTYIYILIIGLFGFIIINSGINAFLVTKVMVQDEETFSRISSILSFSDNNKIAIEKLEEGFKLESENIENKNNLAKNAIWLETKGAFSIYYKTKQTYNKNWNEIISILKEQKAIKLKGSFTILKNPDSSAQEEAGLLGAIKGTLFIVIIFLSFASITGIATGIFLSEFATNKKLRSFISLNISNLASVPPIIYGIFGINFLINTMHIPRSSSLLGGLIIGLLTLPIVVIVTTDALKSVPSHLKFSAKALGLTQMQTVFRVCLPYAFPRILTGILLTLSRGISEATPLILIGMASFIQSPPGNFSDPATTIATQIYLWVTNPDGSFIEKAYGSIFVLLVIVGSINLVASFIRYKVLKRTAVR